MAEQHPSKTMGGDWTDSGPSVVEIVGKEFVTGKLHEAWHGEQTPPEPAAPQQVYTDDILKRLQEREVERAKQPSAPAPTKAKPAADRDDDFER